MISYKDLGLVNTKEMFAKAVTAKFAVPAYNFFNMEQLQAVMRACVETQSPVMLQVSSSARKYMDPTLVTHMVRGGVEMMKKLAADQGLKEIPIALHLDHGDSFELCKACIENGFSSVMIDASHHSFEENIRISKEVAEFAHKHDVSVEAELGVLAGIEDEVVAEHSTYTQPEEVIEFVEKTGVDSLAISIGTSHGANKFKPEQCERGPDGRLVPPPLRFDILEEIEQKLPGFPIVLHGASSVPQEPVDIINACGGKLADSVGIPEDQLRRACESAVCKVNIDSDGRLWMTAAVRKVFSEKPGEYDPRKYMGPAREALYEMYKYKNTKVLGSAGQA